MLWGKNKRLQSDEYESLLVRIRTVEESLAVFKVQIAQFETNLNSMRGLINRKLGKYDLKEYDDDNPYEELDRIEKWVKSGNAQDLSRDNT